MSAMIGFPCNFGSKSYQVLRRSSLTLTRSSLLKYYHRSAFLELEKYSSIFIDKKRHYGLAYTRSLSSLRHQSSGAASQIPTLTGEECYNLSLEYYKKHKEQQNQLEDKKSIDQFEAMIKMTSKNTNNDNQSKNINRQANIAVVQTIAKQTREINLDQKNGQENKAKKDDHLNYVNKANQYMQYAAFVHGYPKALIQIANELLETTSLNRQSTMFQYINSSMETTVDVESLLQDRLTNTEIAKKLYRFAIDHGDNSVALYNLAHILWSEANDADEDEFIVRSKKLESFQLFYQAAIDRNDMDALYFLGVQYMTLLGTITDDIEKSSQNEDLLLEILKQTKLISITKLRQRGYEMILQSSKLDHAGASYYLSLLYRNGDIDLEIEPSMTKFRHYLNLACDGDNVDADAIYLRAHCIYHNEDGYGNDTSNRFKHAYNQFIRAGEEGNPDGYISAGAMLHNGHQIPKDQRKAFELYQHAAEMGSKEGWRNVVACYALGQGVPKCEETAKHITETMLSDDNI